jgi:hypothetical protein
LGGIEDALRHQVLPALGDLRRSRARAGAFAACVARVVAEATIFATNAEACTQRT